MGCVGEVTVSVLMLTYNRQNMVKRAIESILGQTSSDFEFIIVDNGSTDKSGAIAEEYAAKDSRIQVIHRPRGSISAGRNSALDAAQGKYVAFIDDDDWTEPDFLEFLVHLIEETGADVAICGAAGRVFDERLVLSPEEAVLELLWRRRYNVQFPTKLIRRTLMDRFRFPSEGKYDDIALMPQLLASAKLVAYHGLPKYTFERHTGNNSAWTTNHRLLTPETLNEYLLVYRRRTQWLTKRFPESADKWQYFEWSFMISMVEKIQRLELSACRPQLEAMLTELRAARAAFLACPEILDFEKDWMEQYVG